MKDIMKILQIIKGIGSCTTEGYQIYVPPTESILNKSHQDDIEKCYKYKLKESNYEYTKIYEFEEDYERIQNQDNIRDIDAHKT